MCYIIPTLSAKMYRRFKRLTLVTSLSRYLERLVQPQEVELNATPSTLAGLTASPSRSLGAWPHPWEDALRIAVVKPLDAYQYMVPVAFLPYAEEQQKSREISHY